MIKAHKEGTATFDELDYAGQAKSIEPPRKSGSALTKS